MEPSSCTDLGCFPSKGAAPVLASITIPAEVLGRFCEWKHFVSSYTNIKHDHYLDTAKILPFLSDNPPHSLVIFQTTLGPLGLL